jgi:hypothetical protein
MQTATFKHDRLMEESEWRISVASREGTPDEKLVASRVLESVSSYQQWERGHHSLMRTVATQSRLEAQLAALRTTAFSLMHRKALFEYLRERNVTGPKRHKLMAAFYGPLEYTDSVIREHNNYVRCGSSYLCTVHIGLELMHDPAFDEPLQLYQEWYSEYFRLFCDSALAETAEERAQMESLDALRPLLKHQLTEARQTILAMSHDPDFRWRETQIRKPTGDTQRLRTLFTAMRAEEARFRKSTS